MTPPPFRDPPRDEERDHPDHPDRPDQPDPPGGGHDRDLLAEARRLLPPEVGVVGLAPRVAGGLLAGAVALTGCGGGSGPGPEVADSRSHVLEVGRALLGGLTDLGAFPAPPRGAWAGCDDLGGKVAYRVSGRLDAGVADGLVEAVRHRLSRAGVDLDVARPGEPVTLQGEHDDVRVQVTGYAGRPVVLLVLLGPCLEVGAADDDLLAREPDRLALD